MVSMAAMVTLRALKCIFGSFYLVDGDFRI